MAGGHRGSTPSCFAFTSEWKRQDYIGHNRNGQVELWSRTQNRWSWMNLNPCRAEIRIPFQTGHISLSWNILVWQLWVGHQIFQRILKPAVLKQKWLFPSIKFSEILNIYHLSFIIVSSMFLSIGSRIFVWMFCTTLWIRLSNQPHPNCNSKPFPPERDISESAKTCTAPTTQ